VACLHTHWRESADRAITSEKAQYEIIRKIQNDQSLVQCWNAPAPMAIGVSRNQHAILSLRFLS
jgi:hypothetical protein